MVSSPTEHPSLFWGAARHPAYPSPPERRTPSMENDLFERWSGSFQARFSSHSVSQRCVYAWSSARAPIQESELAEDIIKAMSALICGLTFQSLLLLWEWSPAGYCCSNTTTYNVTLMNQPNLIKAACASSRTALNALLVSHKVSATHLGADEALCVFSCPGSAETKENSASSILTHEELRASRI